MPRRAQSKALKKARKQGNSRGKPAYSGPTAREKIREIRFFHDIPKQIVGPADPNCPSYSSLPLDVLCIIFSYIEQDYPLTSVLSHVCKRWRTCALLNIKKVYVSTPLRAALAFAVLPTVTDVSIISILTHKQQQCTCMAARLLTSLRSLAITYTGCGCLLPILQNNAHSLVNLDLTLWHNAARKSYPEELFDFVINSGFLSQLRHLSINLPLPGCRDATEPSQSFLDSFSALRLHKAAKTTPDVVLAESFLAFVARHGTQLTSLAIRSLVLDKGVVMPFFQDTFLPTLTSLDVPHCYLPVQSFLFLPSAAAPISMLIKGCLEPAGLTHSLQYPFLPPSPVLRDLCAYRGFDSDADTRHPSLDAAITSSLSIQVPSNHSDGRDRLDRMCSVATRVTSLRVLCDTYNLPLERFWMPHALRLRHLQVPVRPSGGVASINNIAYCTSLTSLHLQACDHTVLLNFAGKHMFPHLCKLQVTFDSDPNVETLCSMIAKFQRASPSIRTFKSSVGRITTRKRMEELEEGLMEAEANGLEHLSLTCGHSSLILLQQLQRLFTWMQMDIVYQDSADESNDAQSLDEYISGDSEDSED